MSTLLDVGRVDKYVVIRLWLKELTNSIIDMWVYNKCYLEY